MYRYAYIKNGDVIRQLERIHNAGDDSLTSGPDGFLNSFLQTHRRDDILLVGTSTLHQRLQTGRIEAVNYREGLGPFRHLARSKAAIKLLQHLLSIRPDRIVCGKVGPMLWACTIAAILLRTPLVFSCHNRLFAPGRPSVQRWRSMLDGVCIRRVTAAVCHGPFLRRQLEEMGLHRERMVEFDVDFSDVLTARDPVLLDERRNTILFVGRIERAKGIFDLLYAFKAISEKTDRWHLLFAGGGRDEGELTDVIAESGLENCVKWLGEQAHADVIGLIKSAAVVVTPTRPEFPEGRCMAAMEALVLGTPVLAPDFGPFKYLVANGENGALFRPGDAMDLRRKLVWMLDEKVSSSLMAGATLSGTALTKTLSFGPALRTAFGDAT